MNSLMKSPLPYLASCLLIFSGCQKPPSTPAANQDPSVAPPSPSPAVSLQATAVPKPTQNAKLSSADWPKEVVWYQIFPERFRNGDPSNDPTRDSLEWPITPSKLWRITPWTGDWYARDSWEKELGSDFFKDGVLDRRYGGDLQGVIDKLDYIADLGVNAIYFNPLFYSRSLHKYDGNTYHHIDPYFGPDPKGDFAIIEKETGGDPATWQWTAADKLFLKLLAEAHKRGLRVILDGVFNHTGRDFFAYKDLRRNQEKSRYRDWYVVYSFDDPQTARDEFDYKGWWGHKTLPVFAASEDGKDMAPGPKKYIFDATRRWMDPNNNGDSSAGIDGWRLDVAPERPAKFWADWNRYVRELNPKAYTSCEIWENPAKLIGEGAFSACMNYYAFAMPVKGFVIDSKISATQFGKALDTRREALPKGAAEVMQNLMGSHDTDRLASMIVNSDLANYSDPEKIEYNSNADVHASKTYKICKPDARERAIQRLVVLFQMTYVGAPMIYYGDEAGMWGANDPDDRLPMAWPDLKFNPQSIDPRGGQRKPDEIGFNSEVFKFYKAAIALRLSHDALRHGDFRVAAAGDEAHTFAFQRHSDSEDLLAVLNRSEQPQNVRVPLSAADAAKFAKAKAIFSTAGEPSGIAVEHDSGAVVVKLPALSGAVIAP